MTQQYQYLPKGSENIGLCKEFHVNAHSSIIHNRQKLDWAKYPSVGGWINKIWYIHAMENSSLNKRMKY